MQSALAGVALQSGLLQRETGDAKAALVNDAKSLAVRENTGA